MDSSLINIEKTNLQQRSYEFSIREKEDSDLISESFDLINQFPFIKRNSKKNINKVQMISGFYKPPSTKTVTSKAKSNENEIKRKMEKVVYAHEEFVRDEKHLRHCSPRLFSYFSNKKKSTNSVPRYLDEKHRKSITFLRKSPCVSPEVERNLFSASFKKEYPKQADLFFPLLLRKNYSKNVHSNQNFNRFDATGLFFVQSISYIKPKKV